MVVLEHVVAAFEFLPDPASPNEPDDCTHADVAIQDVEGQRGVAWQDLRQHRQTQDGKVARARRTDGILRNLVGRFDLLSEELGEKSNAM
jgi:hypothetical protein